MANEYTADLNPAPNPPDLPWTVYRHGNPIVHWRHEVYAQLCADLMNEGDSLEVARQKIRNGPDYHKPA